MTDDKKIVEVSKMYGGNSMGKGNFVISVKETKNGNWEGTIFWAQEKKEIYFRSSLELLVLIESAISSDK